MKAPAIPQTHSKMGNTSSLPHPTPLSLTVDHRPRPSKPAQPRLRHKLSCVTAWSSQESLTLSDSSATSSLNEKRSAAVHQLVQLTQPDESTVEATPDVKDAFDDFADVYPEYRQTWILDSLRRSDYSRLVRSDEAYVDYMGGCLFPESLVKVHSDFLSRNIMGNTHSVSNRLAPFPD